MWATFLRIFVILIYLKMISIKIPSADRLDRFLSRQSELNYTYPWVGESTTGRPAGYDVDENSILLGMGEQVWEQAKAAFRQWKMFPEGWTYIYPPTAPLVVGTVIAMNARGFGLWWRNSCRIVYVIDEANRFGFAYGTLPGHMERGEELFLLERNEKGAVTYRIRAFSRPRFWLARMAYPVMRRFQRKFARDSKAGMLAVSRALTP